MVAGFSAALALVAGVGMSQAERESWLTSARAACKHLPEDLFRDGVNAARRQADHPSKIVPAIVAYAEDGMRNRRADLANVEALAGCERRMPWEPSAETEDTIVTPEQVAAIKAEFGLSTAPYGEATKRPDRGPARVPTAEETRAMMEEAGLPLAPIDNSPPPSIVGLTVTQIHEQARRLREQQIAQSGEARQRRLRERSTQHAIADEMEEEQRFYG
jgi:hypothetical protein